MWSMGAVFLTAPWHQVKLVKLWMHITLSIFPHEGRRGVVSVLSIVQCLLWHKR